MKDFKEFSKTIKLRYLPAVSRLQIEVTGVNPYALVMGLVRKNRIINSIKLRNVNKYNMYVQRQYSRLYSLASRGEYLKFETVAYTLIKRSKIYRLIMIHHADHNWMLKPLKKINKIWDLINRLLDNNDHNLKYSRWWIDKTPGDYARPIGAPKYHWKVILLMYLQVLEIFCAATGKLKDWQHAGRSKKGLVTCWAEVASKVMKHAYIYEFDLSGFFDRINNQNTIPELPTMNEFFNKLSNVRPQQYPNIMEVPHPPKEKWEADHRLDDMQFHGHLKHIFERNVDKPWNSHLTREELLQMDYLDFIAFGGMDMTSQNLDEFEMSMMNIDLLQPKELRNEYKELMTEDYTPRKGLFFSPGIKPADKTDLEIGRDSWKNLGEPNHGYPQGANTSPFMSCLKLMNTLGDFKNLVMYMDDGLIYGNSREEVLKVIDQFKSKLSEIGLSINESKSGWVREGNTIHDFKFLGIKAGKEKIVSKTRSGTSESLFITPIGYEDYVKVGLYFGFDEETLYKVYQSFLTTTQWNQGKYFGDLGGGFGLGLQDRIVMWLKANGHDLELNLQVSGKRESRVKHWLTHQCRDKAKGLRWAIEKGMFQYITEFHASDEFYSKTPFESTLSWSSDRGFLSNIVAEAFAPGGKDNQIKLSIKGTMSKLDRIYKSKNTLAYHVASLMNIRERWRYPNNEPIKLTELSANAICKYTHDLRRRSIVGSRKRSKLRATLRSNSKKGSR
jgi:hypothetical protein